MKTAVVIPNWNGLDFLAECLDSLKAQTAHCSVVVVDNGSTDGSAEMVERDYPEFRLIRLDRNYGFAGGVNRGIEAALADGTEFVALLNNDAVAQPDWLERLLESAGRDEHIGTVTSKIVDRNGKLDSTGDFYSVWGLPYPRGRGELDKGQYDSADLRQILAGSGGASLYRVEMLKDVGLFDEDFFAYYEDVDLGLRARLHGWSAVYESKAVVLHHIGGTSSKHGHFARYHASKNFVYLYLKNMPGGLYWRYLPRFLAGYVLMSGNSLLTGQAAPMFKALGTIIVKLPATLAKRWRIQRRRTVSPGAICPFLLTTLPPTSKKLTRLKDRFRRALGRSL